MGIRMLYLSGMNREQLIIMIMERIYTRRIYAEALADDILALFGERFCLCRNPDKYWDSGQVCFCGKCNKLVDAC
jgi:hypothetical protein